ncbi:MAG: hypothetical protein AAGA19_06560 [Pseudomonadota bacterium]
MLNPLQFWLNSLYLPLSGDVAQTIDPWIFSPDINLRFAGKPELEGRIIGEVASYGRQLDRVIAAVLTLADPDGPDPEVIEALAKLEAEIADKKAEYSADLVAEVETALTTLRDTNPKAHAALIARQR